MIRSMIVSYHYDKNIVDGDAYWSETVIDNANLVSFETLNEALDNLINLDYMKVSSPKDIKLCSTLIGKSCLFGPALYIYTNDARLKNLPSPYIVDYSPDYHRSFMVYNRIHSPTSADGIQMTEGEYQHHPNIKKMAMELIVSDSYHA